MTRALAAVVLLVMCIGAMLYATSVPDVARATAPPTSFSAERAMTHVRVLAQRPRPIGSEAHAAARAYLLSQLTTLGLTPVVQHATAIGTRYAEAGSVQNVLARLPGTRAGGKAVLLMAHYDGVAAAPAAGDDASGSAVLLETLRAIRAGGPLQHDVIVLFADGEEAGLLGAAAFVREHPWAKDVGITMNFEARGTRGPSFMFETGPGNLDVARVLRGVRGVRATSLSTFVYRRLPNDTDISELAVLNGPALNFAFIGGVDRYHTAQDDVAHLDPRSIQHHGNSAVVLTRAFGNGELPRPTTGDAVFFELPVVGLVAYPERWALPFAVLALLPLVLAVVFARSRDPLRVRGALLGAAGAVAALALGVVVAVALARLLEWIHLAIGSGSPRLSGIYAAAIALASFAVSAALYAVVRRWAPPPSLHFGALALWAMASLLLAVVAPGVSFLFTWPLFGVATGFAALRRSHKPGMAVSAIGWAVAIFLLLPTTYTMAVVALGLDSTGATIIAVFTALAAWLMSPLFEPTAAGPWLTAAIATAAALVLIMIGASTVRTDDDHPVGTAFGYGVAADEGGAWLGAAATTRWARVKLREGMRTDETRAPAPEWFTRYFSATGGVTIPGVKLGTATVRIVSDSALPTERRVVVHVTPAPLTQSIALSMDSGTVRSATIDGRLADTTRYRYRPRGRWFMEYFAPPDSGFTIAFAMPLVAGPTLSLTSFFGGIPEPARQRLPARSPGMIPIQRGDVTLVQQRVRLLQ